MINLTQLASAGNVQLVINANDLASAIKEFCRETLAHERMEVERAREAEREANQVNELYYTREEASDQLHVSLRTIDYYVKNRLLESKKIGHRVLISRKSVANLPTCN